jgi:transcription initiation factor TFIIIB Brf1 subunit/transcription initiation factor TFIIB
MAKNKGGRPPHQPTAATRKQVETLAGYGVQQAEIGKVIGVSDATLRKHYAEELALGETKANSLVAESLFKKATGDGPQAVTAAIFWMKTRARWKEPAQRHEHSGPDNRPILTADLTKATDEQLQALEAVFGPLAGEPGGDDGGDSGGEGEADG